MKRHKFRVTVQDVVCGIGLFSMTWRDFRPRFTRTADPSIWTGTISFEENRVFNLSHVGRMLANDSRVLSHEYERDAE